MRPWFRDSTVVQSPPRWIETKQELDEIQKLGPALVAVRARQAKDFPMSVQSAATGTGSAGPTPARGATDVYETRSSPSPGTS